jgi:hypothetical protein
MSLASNQIPIYANLPRTSVADLNAATAGTMGATTNAVTAFTAGASGSIVDAIQINSTDTAAVNLFMFIVGSDGVTVKPLWQINVPLSSGNLASVLSVDGLLSTVAVGALIDQNGKRFIRLGPSETLRVSTVANMTAAKHCYVTVQGADF